jgi:hypothetical protein
VANAVAERDDFVLHVSKSVPQRLKPSSAQAIYGTTEQAAEKLGFRVGRGFIPGIKVVIFVAFRP